jgi:hypothetical protein
VASPSRWVVARDLAGLVIRPFSAVSKCGEILGIGQGGEVFVARLFEGIPGGHVTLGDVLKGHLRVTQRFF